MLTVPEQERERDAVNDAVRRAGEAEGAKLQRQREAEPALILLSLEGRGYWIAINVTSRRTQILRAQGTGTPDYFRITAVVFVSF